ncbi:MAG: phosphoribosylformylglycinamidine synthase subunit PurS [Thermosediminibacterales bacterium]|nr:phosphoribosylformylglycinamidine synthase subunit PurS [Thermosediminibacterales bacterium]MDK2835324.1 phosphoribosylformylglycinamidine synthase subunit PurS [Thermosediminibacterales bacterium]
MLLVKVYVTLKKGVLDPKGTAVKSSLNSMGFEGVEDVRIGKYMEIKLNIDGREEAAEKVKEMCDKLLANPVIEDYDFEITEV